MSRRRIRKMEKRQAKKAKKAAGKWSPKRGPPQCPKGEVCCWNGDRLMQCPHKGGHCCGRVGVCCPRDRVCGPTPADGSPPKCLKPKPKQDEDDNIVMANSNRVQNVQRFVK